jgi:hypothetical protein
VGLLVGSVRGVRFGGLIVLVFGVVLGQDGFLFRDSFCR